MASNPKLSRLDRVEAWWALFFRIAAGIVGLVIASLMAVTGQWNLGGTVLAIGLCGPVVAAAAGSFAEAFTKGGS